MIRSFRHKGLKSFYEDGSLAGIQAKHAVRLEAQLSVLDVAKHPDEMDVSGWNLHPLKGDLASFWSVKVSGNWRLIFAFDGTDITLVDYTDYH